jgi:uncharacterized delta-60 repeat protein
MKVLQGMIFSVIALCSISTCGPGLRLSGPNAGRGSPGSGAPNDVYFNFGTGFDNWVWAIARSLDGSGDLYFGGGFTAYSGTSNVNRFARLNNDGSIDTGLNMGTGPTAGFNANVNAIAPADDGTGDIYVGGIFTSYNGIANIRRIVRLNSDGSVDSSFDIGTGGSAGFDAQVDTIATAGDGTGDIYVGGAFTTYNATSNTNRLIRLNSDGSIDTAFNIGSGASAGFDFSVSQILPLKDGTGDVYVGGVFTTYNGTANINRIIRLNSDGSMDSGFDIGLGGTAGASADVAALALATDGSADLYIGGSFFSYNGAANIRRITRLNSDGSLDTGFDIGSGGTAGFNSSVAGIVAAADGSGDVYVGGSFTSYRGISNVNRIARLNSDGSLDSGFDSGSGASAGFDTSVYCLASSASGSSKIYVGGLFSLYNSISQPFIAVISSTGASL